MQLQQSHSFVYTAVLFGLANIAGASPLKAAHTRATTFDPTTATQGEFASHALEVAQSRVVSSSTCSAENISVRKLWENLTSDERIAYTDALNCLMDKPAKTPSDVAPGAKTRYDDFIVTHINQTLTIHSTVWNKFLTKGRSNTDHSLGKLPWLAPLVHLGDGAGLAERMQLHGFHPLLGLDKDSGGRVCQLGDVRRLRDIDFWQRCACELHRLRCHRGQQRYLCGGWLVYPDTLHSRKSHNWAKKLTSIFYQFYHTALVADV